MTAIEQARHLLAGLSGRDQAVIGPHDTLVGLGLDSLDWVALAVTIEQLTGAEIADDTVLRIRTVADLADQLNGGQQP
jgi:acyl carrier protein